MSSTRPALPRLLHRAWKSGDPSEDSLRRCDAEDRQTLHRRLETIAGAYWICSACGQMHREDVPADLPGIYDDRWTERIETKTPTKKEREECDSWLRRVAPYRQTGRLYEVGCGLGLFLTMAAQAGWAVEGSELSPVAARHASEQSGGRISIGPIESVAMEEGVYDVILCNNVFEHLREPLAVLRKLGAALRPGGVMFFQTLSAQSFSLVAAPTHWLYYDEGHLFVPTLVSLHDYFEKAGLRAVRFETHGFRSAARAETMDSGRQRHKRIDKLVASVAARAGRGHRVKVLLERPAPTSR